MGALGTGLIAVIKHLTEEAGGRVCLGSQFWGVWSILAENAWCQGGKNRRLL